VGSVSDSEKEINLIKKMLMNTLTEESLDEMYAKAREKYTMGSTDPRN
jgi:hypothetical protein